MKFSKKILETFIDLPKNWQDLMEDIGLEIKSIDGDIFNLELLANRGDHYCYIGLAREINGRTGTGVTVPDAAFCELPEWQTDKSGKMSYKGVNYVFDIETKKCLSFALTPFKLSKPQKQRSTQDEYIKRMLAASGVNIIHPAIDITNVVMLELGQPAHVYDADKIKGKIHIRETKKGEKAALLFHEGLTPLPAGTIVIADEEKILCVGGVIGCHAAEVDENTKNILFETALFDPVSIRKTSRALGITTIASQIFERGGDIGTSYLGACRATALYKEVGWVCGGDFQHMTWGDAIPPKFIEVSGSYISEQLEIDITDKEITERLRRYGFFPDVKKTGFFTPTWRMWDIKGEPADLIEELARSIGYNTLPSKLPAVEIGAGETKNEKRKTKIGEFLVTNGFYEVFTDSMYSPKHAAVSPIKEHMALENSVDGGYAFMKNNATIQAIELVAKNLNMKNREIRAFEWGKVFQNDGEHNVLWGVMNGKDVSVLTVKGLIENLMRDLGLEYEFDYTVISRTRHPKRNGAVLCNGEKIGVFGEIHPALLAEFDIKNDTPVFFEFFDVEKLLSAPARKVKYESPAAIIPSTRDISIAVPYGRAAGDVTAAILKNYKQVARAEITDIYDKPKESLRNITFTLTFAGEHSTEDLNKLILEIIHNIVIASGVKQSS
ncbi:MAG: phenylalanine--tRNA ligase subunit beta [Alphaproteobacteria bacterium]|nr:phenylalanine--tRNA ligase subunit beta [Alphaproteobacteria bacterium]